MKFLQWAKKPITFIKSFFNKKNRSTLPKGEERRKALTGKVVDYVLDFIIYLIIVTIWAIWIALHLLFLMYPIAIALYLFYPVFWIIRFLSTSKFKKYSNGRIIVYGGLGKGKSLLFSRMISLDKNKPLGNVDFGYNEIVHPKKYFESIAPNTFKNFISNSIIKQNKVESWEGRNYYYDDSNTYMPNLDDNYLKKEYPSMASFLLIQRHLYNSTTKINAQTVERMYILLRELQMDGYIKARFTLGFQRIIRSLPIFNKFVFVGYYYYELDEARGKLPYSEIALLDKMASPLHVGAGRALEKIYNAENGNIVGGVITIPKKSLKYDTRYFHELVFGFKATKN